MINKRILNINCLIAFLLVLSVCYSNSTAQEIPENIEKFLSQCENYRLFHGSALVAREGRVIYKKGFAYADRRWNIPNKSSTRFMTGSISKQFTAMLVLQMAEEGKIKLKDKISGYLDYYPADKGDKISIHHLLCHSSGIPNILQKRPDFFTDVWVKDHSSEEFIKLFCDYKLDFEPGSKFMYNTANYFILAAVLEKVSGKLYNDMLQEKIFKPLGMNGSGSNDFYTIIPEMASGYEYWNFRFSNTGHTSPTVHTGGGSVYSTVEDLFKWDRALYTNKLLSKQYMDMMFSPQMPLRGGRDYSYGWVMGEKYVSGLSKELKFTEHTGNYPGFCGLIFRLTEENHTIIVLNNTSDANVNYLRDQLINILYGLPYNVQEPLSFVLNNCKNTAEIQSVLETFKSDRSKHSIRRDALNGLGFKLIRDKKIKSGLAVLEFNAEEHPNVFFVYESLGEAYLKTGAKELAAKNFSRVLEINPENKYAKRKLKELETK